MKTEYFTTENLLEPWKETFTREEVEELREKAFEAGVYWKEKYKTDIEKDWIVMHGFNKFKKENPLP